MINVPKPLRASAKLPSVARTHRVASSDVHRRGDPRGKGIPAVARSPVLHARVALSRRRSRAVGDARLDRHPRGVGIRRASEETTAALALIVGSCSGSSPVTVKTALGDIAPHGFDGRRRNVSSQVIHGEPGGASA